MTLFARTASAAAAAVFLCLSGPAGAAFESWLEGLPEAEFAMPGHVVADLAVEAVRRGGETTTATIEVLTVEER